MIPATMALNKEVFKTRALSAVVFVAIMLAGLLWNHWSLLLLFSIIHFGCWWEYLRLQEQIRRYQYHIYFKVGLMSLGYCGMLMIGSLADTQGKYDVFWQLFLPLQLASMVVLVLGLFKDRQYHRQYVGTAAAAFGGLPYISISWGLMLQLGLQSEQAIGSPGGWLYPVLLIAAIWINDTMAYIVGSMIGKTPLSKISPKKTLEGTIGGAVLAVAVVTGLAVWLLHTSWWQVAAISATAAVVGTLGDLLESWLKRMAGVKDSGQMMPGHGGFLDRFDSLLLATPCVWLLLKVMA